LHHHEFNLKTAAQETAAARCGAPGVGWEIGRAPSDRVEFSPRGNAVAWAYHLGMTDFREK
ncbi:hypothetical protein V490_09127, partial [Pseudogymnoascus sp. VKM F-3557]